MKSNSLKHRLAGAILIALALGAPAFASSHREALTVLNEPCADNTDTYAWVSNGDHSKLYLIMDFNPLHEPGQGNQGFRACNGYRYEFHIGKGTSLKDEAVYRIEFRNTLPGEAAPSATDALGGGNEVLWQLTGGTEKMTITRIFSPGNPNPTVLGENLDVLPNNHGPQTDRLVYGLGAFEGYNSGNSTSRDTGLYDQAFINRFIHTLAGGARAIAGQFDDPYQLDEKGIFDLVNLAGLPGARKSATEDVFTGFNIFSIALEIPTSDLFPNGIPHNGTLQNTSTDALLRIWTSIQRQATQTVDVNNNITGLRGSGNYTQVGRNALPLFNAGLVGAAKMGLYLHTDPQKDVSRFGAEILFPVLVRDAEALGIYKALGVPDSSVATLKGPRLDIINAINLGRPIPVADGSTGDVLTLDASIDSQFPNGRRIGGGTAPNKNQVNVNTVLIGLIVAGDPAFGNGVYDPGVNDKDYNPNFPFLAPAHQGVLQGHGGVNNPVVPTPPLPTAIQPCQ